MVSAPGTRNIPEHSGTSNNYDNYEKKCAQIGQRDIMFFFAGRTTNAYGRTFHRGKSIEKYMRSLIIDDILSGGENVSTEYYPGSFRAIGSK